MNLWMKRAIGVAALGGGLLALGTGTASAQEVSADLSTRVGRSTAAEVRVCADGRVLSRLVGSCSGQASSGRTSATVQAGRSSGSSAARVRARVPRLALADVSVGTRRSRPSAAASGQASTTTPRTGADATAAADTSPRASADATASLSRPRPAAARPGPGGQPGRGGPARVEPLHPGRRPGHRQPPADRRADPRRPDRRGPSRDRRPRSGPIASGNQVDAGIGDVSPSVPVTVCGNGVGLLGDASVGCGADTSTGGIIAPPPVTPPGQSDTGTSGTLGTPGSTGSTGTSGLLGTNGLTRAPAAPPATRCGGLQKPRGCCWRRNA